MANYYYYYFHEILGIQIIRRTVDLFTMSMIIDITRNNLEFQANLFSRPGRLESSKLCTAERQMRADLNRNSPRV